jgi:hypothetical protein
MYVQSMSIHIATRSKLTRRAGSAIIALAALSQAAPTAASNQDQAIFDVYVLGVRAGHLAYSAVEDNGRYAVNARLETSGLVRMIRQFTQDASAEGRLNGPRLEPIRYARASRRGDERSETAITFRQGVPDVTRSEAEDPPPWAIDPADQRGALDPLSALYAVLREIPQENACAAPMPIYDGTRRAEVVFAEPEMRDGTLVCAAEYRRLAGYPPERLEEQTRFPFQLEFTPSGEGRVQVTRLRLNSQLGPATAVRR